MAETMTPKPFPAAFHEGTFAFPTLGEAHAAEGYPAAHNLITPDLSLPWWGEAETTTNNKVEILPSCASQLGGSESKHT